MPHAVRRQESQIEAPFEATLESERRTASGRHRDSIEHTHAHTLALNSALCQRQNDASDRVAPSRGEAYLEGLDGGRREAFEDGSEWGYAGACERVLDLAACYMA